MADAIETHVDLGRLCAIVEAAGTELP